MLIRYILQVNTSIPRRHAFDSAGRPPEAEERSAPTLDRRDRFTRDDIRLGGLGKREEKVLRGKPR
jgi:hypothetical protein